MGNFSTTFGLGQQETQTGRRQVDSLLRPPKQQLPYVKTNKISTTNTDSQNDC